MDSCQLLTGMRSHDQLKGDAERRWCGLRHCRITGSFLLVNPCFLKVKGCFIAGDWPAGR
jgi:hypothetical protein